MAWLRRSKRDEPAGTPEPACVPVPETPAAMPQLLRFAAAGSAPLLRSWQLAGVIDPDVLAPELGRVELWNQTVANPPIRYPHLVAGFGPDGELRVIAAAELLPDMHDQCYLGVFIDGAHQNLGADDQLRDERLFVQRAWPLVLEALDPSPMHDSSAPPPPPPTMSRDQAIEELRTLRLQSPATWTATEPADVVASLRRMRDLALALDLGAPTYEGIARAVEQPEDAEAMFSAGYQLIDVGIADLAVGPLTRSLELLPGHGPTLDELAIALESADRPDEAARLLLAHPAVLDERESTRGLCSHYAAMAGELGTARQLAERITSGGDFGYFRDRALARCARADALAGVTPLHGGDLRGWEAVLNGTVVLHLSEFGYAEAESDDDSTYGDIDADTGDGMNGRYGAVWDNEDRFRGILAMLTTALGEAGRMPARVVAGADRDSQILGWALATTLGLGPPVAPEADDTDGRDGPTLVALFDWSQLDRQLFDRYFRDPDAVLFAYNLNWTSGSSAAPDLAGIEAQALFRAWGQRMRTFGTPGEGPVEVVNEPPDDRDPQIIGTVLVAEPAAAPPEDVAPVLALVRALRAVPDSVGLLGGRRDRFHPDGPVRSARFM